MSIALPLSALAVLLAVPTCGGTAPSAASPRPAATRPPPPDTTTVDGVATALAELRPVGGSDVTGTMRLVQTARGVRVRVLLDGLGGSGDHALQILYGRSCDADPALHLGADSGSRHGGPFRPSRHAGDLGTVRADRGQGRYDRIDPALALDGQHSPVGHAVVVRDGPDDATTQPDGAAGAVLACGVLQPGV